VNDLSEAELERIERSADPAIIPELVRTIRAQQRELDNLRLSFDVARRDREELRAALLQEKKLRITNDELPRTK
jgi:hypothetical protein